MGLRGLWDVMVYLHTKVKSKEIDLMLEYFFIGKEKMTKHWLSLSFKLTLKGSKTRC